MNVVSQSLFNEVGSGMFGLANRERDMLKFRVWRNSILELFEFFERVGLKQGQIWIHEAPIEDRISRCDVQTVRTRDYRLCELKDQRDYRARLLKCPLFLLQISIRCRSSYSSANERLALRRAALHSL